MIRLPRFRLRTLLVAVVIAGLACGGAALVRRAATCRARAAFHARQEERSRAGLHAAERVLADVQATISLCLANGKDASDFRAGLPFWRQRIREWRTRTARHAAARSMYERAARYPWLPADPEPTEAE